MLYKFFNKRLVERLTPYIMKCQSVDQAAYRKNFSTEDHLYTLSQLQEKAAEWRQDIWICAVDFKKAFDTVEHRAVWTALTSQRVPSRYVELLRGLYEGQTGRVVADKASRTFKITRGTKQGGPISPSLFSAVLEYALQETKRKWSTEDFGVMLGEEE